MQNTSGQSRITAALYALFNPIPIGFFVAAWIFDILYIQSFQPLWADAASWLIVFGLVLAIIPRLINLVQVWITQRQWATPAIKISFWLWLLAIVLAIINAFFHSRDAYAVVPLGVILSTIVVVLLVVDNVQLAARPHAW